MFSGMKLLMVAMLVCGVVGVARGVEMLEFAGYIKAGSETKFVLADLVERKVSDWLTVGESFAGYLVSGFEAGTETLLLEKAGVVTRLRLKSASLAAGKRREPVDVEYARTGPSLSLLIRRHEEAMAPGPKKVLLNAAAAHQRWLDIFEMEEGSAREKRKQWRESVSRGLPPWEYGIDLQVNFLRYLSSTLQEKKRTVLSEIPDREMLLQRFDKLAALVQKDMADEGILAK